MLERPGRAPEGKGAGDGSPKRLEAGRARRSRSPILSRTTTPSLEREGRHAFPVGASLRRSGGWLLSVLVHGSAAILVALFASPREEGTDGAWSRAERRWDAGSDSYRATLRFERAAEEPTAETPETHFEEPPDLAPAERSPVETTRAGRISESRDRQDPKSLEAARRAPDSAPRSRTAEGGERAAPGESPGLVFGIPARRPGLPPGANARPAGLRGPGALHPFMPGPGAMRERWDLLVHGVPNRNAVGVPSRLRLASLAPASIAAKSRSLGAGLLGRTSFALPSAPARGGTFLGLSGRLAVGRFGGYGYALLPGGWGPQRLSVPLVRGDVPRAEVFRTSSGGVGSRPALSGLNGSSLGGPRAHGGSASINGSEIQIRH